MVLYVDDFCISGTTETLVNNALDYMINNLESLGFNIAHKKTKRATTVVEFLGCEISKNKITLSKKGKAELLRAIEEAL